MEENITNSSKVILIAGPTASGKSALALALAAEFGGAVINADSMQVYRELRILTNRPTPEDEAQVPHLLYGFRPAAEAYSTALWLNDLKRTLHECAASGRVPVIVGGTGLYFKALFEGLSAIPPIPQAIREEVRAKAASLPAPALHDELKAIDP
jgi:tRNA dimethylallyltransferase